MTATPRLERTRERPRHYLLRLYVAGATASSQRAIENVKTLCEQHLKARYKLEVIDVYQQPQSPQHAQIIAVPTLFKLHPSPARKFIGDMSGTERILRALDKVGEDEVWEK